MNADQVEARFQALEQALNNANAALAAAGANRRAPSARINAFTNEPGDDWLSFIHHFRSVVQLNGYNDEQQRLALSGAMKGKAALATLDIDVTANIGANPPTIETVIPLFRARFLPAAASQLARAKFDQTRQGNTEPILDFHSRLRALYNQAYPDAADQVPLIRRFILGLRRKELRLQAMRVNPGTYAAALEVAQNESSVQSLGRVTELGAAPAGDEPMEIGAVQQPPQQPRGNCHFCGKTGHWKQECELLAKAKRFGGNQGKGNQGNSRGRPGGRGGRPAGRQALIAALEAALQEEEDGADPGSAVAATGAGEPAAPSAGGAGERKDF